MKICPSCRQTYNDDNLNFCLNDGSYLQPFTANEPKTVLMDEPRITNQTNWEQQNYQPPSVWEGQQSIQNQQPNYLTQVGGQSQSLATVSLVLGIFGLLLFCCQLGVPLGAGALITGFIAMNQEKSNPEKYSGRGLAIGGMITGGIALIIGIGYFILTIAGMR